MMLSIDPKEWINEEQARLIREFDLPKDSTWRTINAVEGYRAIQKKAKELGITANKWEDVHKEEARLRIQEQAKQLGIEATTQVEIDAHLKKQEEEKKQQMKALWEWERMTAAKGLNLPETATWEQIGAALGAKK